MRPTPIDRARQLRRLLRSEGFDGVRQRVGARVAERLTPSAGRARLPVSTPVLMRAGEIATAGWQLPPPLEADDDEPLSIAWVSAPTSGPGSGGHMTMFRQIEALERAGHRCILYFDDPNGWSIAQHTATTRALRPSMRADIRDAAQGIDDAHAIFATSWETAYPVLASRARGVRFYLVQDFEPWFYPAGSAALLAEATYRFGFHGITAGRWLAEILARDYGMSADHFDFGCDLAHYGLKAGVERTGICYYARFTKPRRAFELGLAALELFAARHPEVDIHLYGDDLVRVPFRAINYGTVGPDQLNEIYNRCVAGLALSATNVSLVPHEMLASGCLPVVNDAEHNRIVLDNDEVVYVPPTPFELADALSSLIQRSAAERDAAAEAASRSVQSRSWDDAGAQVESALRSVVHARARGALAVRS